MPSVVDGLEMRKWIVFTMTWTWDIRRFAGDCAISTVVYSNRPCLLHLAAREFSILVTTSFFS
jgi:hypothetical protein